jgi:hypothetical protein
MGTTVSGSEPTIGLLDVELNGSPFLTGGTFGLETSVISLLFYVLASVLILRLPVGGRIELLSDGRS